MKRLLTFFFALLFTTAFNQVHAQTTSSGEVEAMMGFARSVSVSDGSVIIGEPANPHQPGLVYIYRKSDKGWTQHSKLSANDGTIGNGFGTSLANDGNLLLIGAPSANDNRGAAYLFERGDDGSWSEVAKLALSDTTQNRLGSSVALQGDLAFIGAPEASEQAGAVYVFAKSESGNWTRQQRLANPDTTKAMSFGSELEVNDSKLIVSAPRKGGVAYVYQSNDKGDWTKEAMLKSKQVSDNAWFGSTLALYGDKVLVGAPRDASGSGSVFVFEHKSDEGSWTSTGKLVAYDGGSRYGFGSSMAIADGKLWVGAPGADHSKGALYQFQQNKSGNEWIGVTKISGPERTRGDMFAGTVAAEEGIAVTGLVGADYGAGVAAILEQNDAGSWTVASTVLSEESSVLKPITGGEVKCTDGQASHFGCNNVNLLSFLPTQAIGGDRGVRLNDIWGWTDPKTGKEYALVGRINGTSFVDVSNPKNPVYVANLPMTKGAVANAWRDIKVYKNHAYVVADNAGDHGVQVVDLTDLRKYDGTPLELEEVAHYDKVNSVHNIVINTDTGFAYAVGSSGGGQTCGGGLHMINIQDPTNPTFAGCFADPSTGRSGTGYTHDAQCVTYHGPDKEHKGQEICFGANETAISIADVTDKKHPKALSTASYPDYAYVHQGWLTEDHRYFFQNDELDELTGNVDETRTIVWDVSDLDDPQFVREFYLDNPSIDHNLYIKGDTMYESNYVSGLQVVDVSNPEKPVKTGFFDTEPFGTDQPRFSGTWSNYPFFESGIIIMTSSQEGLFILENADQPVQASR